MNFTRLSKKHNTIQDSLYKQASGIFLVFTIMPSSSRTFTRMPPAPAPARQRRCGSYRGKKMMQGWNSSHLGSWSWWIAPGGGWRWRAPALGGGGHYESVFGEAAAKAEQQAMARALGGPRVEYRVVGRLWVRAEGQLGYGGDNGAGRAHRGGSGAGTHDEREWLPFMGGLAPSLWTKDDGKEGPRHWPVCATVASGRHGRARRRRTRARSTRQGHGSPGMSCSSCVQPREAWPR
jgi:hypothetical protein